MKPLLTLTIFIQIQTLLTPSNILSSIFCSDILFRNMKHYFNFYSPYHMQKKQLPSSCIFDKENTRQDWDPYFKHLCVKNTRDVQLYRMAFECIVCFYFVIWGHHIKSALKILLWIGKFSYSPIFGGSLSHYTVAVYCGTREVVRGQSLEQNWSYPL